MNGRQRGSRKVLNIWGSLHPVKLKKKENLITCAVTVSDSSCFILDLVVSVEVGISRQTGITVSQGVFTSHVFTLSEGEQFQLCVEILEGEVQQEDVVVLISSFNGSAFSK